MAEISSRAWRNVAIIAAILLAGGMLVSGLLIPGLALLVILLALGGGALLRSKAGPPHR
jgi:hypothetical protein